MNDYQGFAGDPVKYLDPSGMSGILGQGEGFFASLATMGTTVFGGYGSSAALATWKGGGMGALQGGANALNGAQDAVVGIANLPASGVNGISYLAGGEDLIGYIPSKDWSEGRFVDEDHCLHNLSKFLGGQGIITLVTLGASQLGTATSLTHLTTAEAAASIEANAAAGAANAGIQGTSIFATGRTAGTMGEAFLTGAGKSGGYVPIPSGMMSAFRPIPAVGPISAWARFAGQGYVMGPVPGQAFDAFMGQVILGTAQKKNLSGCPCK
jgi:hypothetical protein